MATASVQKGTDPTGSHVATHSFTGEDSVTKHVQRITIETAGGKSITATTTQKAPVGVTVSTLAVHLAADATRIGFVIQNRGTDSVFMGYSSGLTTANGYEIAPGAGWADKGLGVFQGDVYLVAASGSQDVRIQAW